jgi:hypothetical protein
MSFRQCLLKVILERSRSFKICTFNKNFFFSFRQFLNRYRLHRMQTNNRLIYFRQSSLKVIYWRPCKVIHYTFCIEKKNAIPTIFQKLLIYWTETPQKITSGHLERSRSVRTSNNNYYYIISADFEQMLITCHTNKIIGIFLSDKAHSRSLCKGQVYSKYTLYVKQTFNGHCACHS